MSVTFLLCHYYYFDSQQSNTSKLDPTFDWNYYYSGGLKQKMPRFFIINILIIFSFTRRWKEPLGFLKLCFLFSELLKILANANHLTFYKSTSLHKRELLLEPERKGKTIKERKVLKYTFIDRQECTKETLNLRFEK